MSFIEYDLPFEEYEPCKFCDGYGSVNLMMTNLEELKKWAERLGLDKAFYGHNICNKCSGGLIVSKVYDELELVK